MDFFRGNKTVLQGLKIFMKNKENYLNKQKTLILLKLQKQVDEEISKIQRLIFELGLAEASLSSLLDRQCILAREINKENCEENKNKR